MKKVNKETADYYDVSRPLYNIFWSKTGVHYGLWDENTKRLADAIDNTNKFVSGLLDLNEEDYVLDAGCGVGGLSVFIAKKYGCKVKGITLSEKQLEQARDFAEKEKVADLVSFEIMDYNNTRFKDGTFTRIFGIESTCHSEDKLKFLKEAHRLLKPGGKLAGVDGFLTKKKLTEDEEKAYNAILRGFKICYFSHREDFLRNMKKVGFKRAEMSDLTDRIMPSSKIMTFRGYAALPIAFVLTKLGLLHESIYEHIICMINQERAFRDFMDYCLFQAEK